VKAFKMFIFSFFIHLKAGQKAKRSSTTNPVAELLTPPVVEADSTAVSKEAGNVVVLREKLGAAAFAAAAAAATSSAAVTPSGRTEKDKSTKRKSNLNRAVTDEQIVSASNDQNESQGLFYVTSVHLSNMVLMDLFFKYR